jgi:hypothetical protein
MALDRARQSSPWAPLVSFLHWASLAILLLCILLVAAIRVYPFSYPYPSLPKVTRTSRGATGDPLNIIMVGNASQITASFTRAGWLVPDPITPQTSARIVADSLAHRAYPTAPVSNLYVFGRVQDLAFEWPTNDVQNRGHIRLWQTPLQLHGQPLWLGAASYDHGIELSGRTGFPTHHILPTVDLERNTVDTDLDRTGLVVAEAYDPYTPPILVAYNGGGDYYASDGQVLAIALVHTALPAPTGLAAVAAAFTRGLSHGYDAILTTLALAVAAILAGVLLVVLALWPVLRVGPRGRSAPSRQR